MELQKFYETTDVYITHDEAWQILVWFFGGNADSRPSSLTYNDRSFAQALLFKAIEASILIGGLEKLWRTTIMPPKSILKAVKQIAKITSTVLWKRIKPVDLENAKVYTMVKDTLTVTYKSAWKIRVETDTAVY